MGFGDKVVGRTRYCIHPQAKVEGAVVVGGTKQIDMQALKACKPDLIIAEKEENRREDVEALAEQWPVYVFDIRSLKHAATAIETLAELCGCRQKGLQLRADIESAWRPLQPTGPARSVLYLIWRKPWMCAGADTYIDAVLTRTGLNNLACDWAGRYPQIDVAAMQQAQPNFVLLSSEPYPFEQKHVQELKAMLPNSEFRLVDGEMFSWYGSRMTLAADYLQTLKLD